MSKKIIAGIIAAAIIVSVVVYFLLKREEPVADSLYKAVPLDAALIINIKNFDELNRTLLSNNQLWGEMATLPFFDKLNGQFRLIDSLKRVSPAINKLFTRKGPMMVSGHSSGRNDIRLVYYLGVPDEADFNDVNQFIKSNRGKNVQLSSRKYEQGTLYDVVFPSKRGDNFTYTWSHGILVLSKSSLLVEDAVRQLMSKESVLDRKGLADIVKTAGKSSLVNFYFKFEHLPKLTDWFIHPKYKTDLNFLKSLGSWVELDLNLKPDMLILNGFSFADMAKPGLETVFKGQKPVKMDIFNKIPSDVNTFTVFGISDYELYGKNFRQFTESRGILPAHLSEIQTLKNDYEIDLEKSFTSVFDQEAAIVLAGNSSDSLALQSFTVIKTKNRDDAEKMLTGFIRGYAGKLNRSASDFVAEFPGTNGQNVKVWKLSFGNIPAMLFGNFFAAGENEYCTLSDNYLVFGQSANAVLQYIRRITPTSAINNNKDFNSFSEYFSEQSNFFFYNKPSYSNGFYSNFFKQDVYKLVKARQEHFDKLQALVYQFNVSDNGLIYNNIFIKYSSMVDKPVKQPEESAAANENANTLETKLDAPAAGKPFLLKNGHGNEPDIFVQDKKNQVYLIAPDGKIRWKIKLSESILSDVLQIDYFQNGKQQILFNTRSKLYLIDRNGKNVGQYPVTLKSPATNGLVVFDYDKTRDYRIFVACDDRKILALDKNGLILKGWEAPKTENRVTKPVQYFRIEGKDFLVFNDKSRLYVLDRKGKPVIKPSGSLSLSVNNKAGLINGRSLKEARFVVSGSKGRVYFIGLDGKIKETDFGKYPENHWFDVYDLNGDGLKEFVFSWGTNLKVMSQKNKELLSLVTPEKLKYRPAFYEIAANNFKIGVVTVDQKVELYNPSGGLINGFPLNGSSPFSVNVAKSPECKFKVITGDNKNSLYQYSVK